MSKFVNCRARGSLRRIALIACSIAVLFMLGLVIGCGGESGGDGESGGAPKGTLAIKGLYVGMPGDRALDAYKKLINGSKDLMVVDFREGIGPELDEETKAKQKQVWEETVKLAEADVDRFLQWHGVRGDVYDPSQKCCEGREEVSHPFLQAGDVNVPIPGPNWVVGSAMAAFAGVNGYQVEWMLPGKRKGDKQGETSALNLFSGKLEVPEKNRDSDPDLFWKREVLEKGLVKDLYSKGLQLSKENKERVFLRLVFADVQGNPIDRKNLATELVLNAPSFFKDYGSNQEKVETAEKELEGFGLWVEFPRDSMSGIKGMNLFDPEDPRTEEAKERERKEVEAMAEMAKRGDSRGMEKMNMMRKRNGQAPLVAKEEGGALSTATAKTAESSTKSKDIAELSSRVSKLTAEINGLKAELSKKEAPNPSLDHEFNNLKRERDTLFSSLKQTTEQFKRNPSLKSKPVVDRYNRDKARLAELNEKYKAAKEKKASEAAVIADIKQQIKNKESDLKMAIAARDKATEEAKAAEEAELAKKNRTDLKFLTAARTGRYGDSARAFARVMMKMAANCKAQLEWAVLTEPADKIEEIIETIALPGGDYTNAVDFARKLDRNLGKFSENWADSDKSRKRVYFEKELEDIYSPLWVRLVLKTTNGVEVAKADVVQKWLEARGQFAPTGRMKISKKPLIEIALNNGATKEKDFRVPCYAWLDNDGNVKKVQFNESGLNRFFNAKAMSGGELSQALVESYPELPHLKPTVKRQDFGDYGQLSVVETTWTYNDPQGYRVDLFERSLESSTGISQKQLMDDPQVAMSLGLAGKQPTKYLTIVTSVPESARKFD